MTFPSLISLVTVQILPSRWVRALQVPQGSGVLWDAEDAVYTGAVHSTALALLAVQMEGSHSEAHGLQGSLEENRILPVIEGRQKWWWLIFQHMLFKTNTYSLTLYCP